MHKYRWGRTSAGEPEAIENQQKVFTITGI